jgi:hypothetical protein
VTSEKKKKHKKHSYWLLWSLFIWRTLSSMTQLARAGTNVDIWPKDVKSFFPSLHSVALEDKWIFRSKSECCCQKKECWNCKNSRCILYISLWHLCIQKVFSPLVQNLLEGSKCFVFTFLKLLSIRVPDTHFD